MRLLARDEADGWGLCSDGQRWWRVQPPYGQKDRKEIDESVALRLMVDQGMQPADEEHADWGALVRSLQEHRWRSLQGLSQARSAELVAWQKVLQRTSTRRATAHLERVEGWIEAGNTHKALDVLTVFLQAEAVANSPELVQRIALLQQKARQRMQPAGPRQPAWSTRGKQEAPPAHTLKFGTGG